MATKVEFKCSLQSLLIGLLYILFFLGPILWATAKANSEPIVIGVLGPLTTPDNTFGIGHLQGITVAIKEFNDNNKNGLNIQLLIADDRADEQTGIVEGKRLYNSGAAVILGPANSSVAKHVIDELLVKENLEIPIVASLVTATNLTQNSKLQSDWFFRANVSDSKLIESMLIEILGSDFFNAERLVVIYQGHGDEFGKGLMNDTKSVLKEKYPNFTAPYYHEHRKNLSSDDADGIVSILIKKGYTKEKDAYLLLDLGFDSLAMIKAIKSRKEVKSKIFAIQVNHREIEKTARDGINVHGTTVFTAYDPGTSLSHKFFKSFDKEIKVEPNEAAAMAYDAAMLVLGAIERIKNTPDSIKGGISEYRSLLKSNLKENEPDEKTFVLSGDHTFQNREYKTLRFKSYVYSFDGKRFRDDDDLPEPPSSTLSKITPNNPSVSFDLPYILLVLFSGLIGSLLRTVHDFGSNPMSFSQLRRHFKNKNAFLILLIIDPLIAFLMFSCAYLLVLFTGVGKNAIEANPIMVLSLSAFVIGVLSGFLGIRAVNKLTDKVTKAISS